MVGLPNETATHNPTMPSTVNLPRSVSEAASDESSGKLTSPNWLRWVEKPFEVKSPESGKCLPEATGWAMDSAARGPINMTGTFLGSAILRLAVIDAGCKRASDCNVRIYGLRPSSLLTTVTAVVGVLAALAMPLVGAVVDHTRYRKAFGAGSALIVVAITGVQISISQENWFAMLCDEAIGGFVFVVHTTAVFAYLPDLSSHENDYVTYTTGFNVRQYGMQVIHSGLIVLIGFLRPASNPTEGAIQTARVSSGMAFVISLFLMGYAWAFLFRKRPALSEVPQGESLLTVGFNRLKQTTNTIWRDYHALRWFMVALLFSPEAGGGVILSIATTFLVSFLRMTSQQVAIVSLIMLAFNVPGSIVSRHLCRRINPLNTYRVSLLAFVSITALTAAVLTGPHRVKLAYGFAAGWGLSLGAMYPTQRVLFCTLIPKNQEMEFMGLFTFFGSILSWLPPLLFTTLNERGIGMQWGLAILPFFSAVSLFWTILMGGYDDAVLRPRSLVRVDKTLDDPATFDFATSIHVDHVEKSNDLEANEERDKPEVMQEEIDISTPQVDPMSEEKGN